MPPDAPPTTVLGRLHARLLPYLRVRRPSQLYLHAVLVGAMAGLAATLFSLGLHWVEGAASDATASGDRRVLFFLLPVLGGLLSGLVTYFLAPEAGGHGTDAMIDAFHNHEGYIRPRIPFVKAVATLFTLGGGGSAGQEGPLAQVGAGFGSWWAGFCSMGVRARRSLLLAGAAGGLGAIFRSPLGGALAAIEVIYREDFESDAFVPCVISSVTGYAVISSFLGGDHIFFLDTDVGFHHPVEIGLYAALGLLCFPLGWLYVRFFYGVRNRVFRRLPLPAWAIPAVGGVVVGVIGLEYPQVLGTGTSYIQSVLSGNESLPWQDAFLAFGLLAVLKVIATTCTVGAGASGGVFAPSLFIGGMLGAIVGSVGLALFPDSVTSVAPYVLVGMGAFFAGVANAPLASLVMVTEMSGGYGLLAPMMAVAIFSLVLNHRWSIYEKQVKNRFDSPAHLWDMRPDVLKTLRIEDAFESLSRRAVVANNMLLFSLEARAQELGTTDFVVVDDDDRYVGVVSLRHLGVREDNAFLRNVVMVEDMARQAPTVDPGTNLREAFAAILSAEMDKVAVVEDGKVLGHVSTYDVLRAYERAVHRMAS